MKDVFVISLMVILWITFLLVSARLCIFFKSYLPLLLMIFPSFMSVHCDDKQMNPIVGVGKIKNDIKNK